MATTFLTSVQVQETYNAMVAAHRKNTDYRMENYFNCVDDYSWGGVCDKAQDQAESRMLYIIDLLKSQEENGGYFIKNVTELVLQNFDGSFLSDTVVKCRYGYCFMWGREQTGLHFCGVAKKQSTYTGKGFKVISRRYELKVVYTGKSTRSGYAQRTVELISVTDSVDDQFDDENIDYKSYDLYILKNK